MKEIAISEFKARCLALLDEVNKTKKPLLVTRFGEPVAQVVPAAPTTTSDWIGSMKDSLEIRGDILSPAVDESAWEALRD